MALSEYKLYIFTIKKQYSALQLHFSKSSLGNRNPIRTNRIIPVRKPSKDGYMSSITKAMGAAALFFIALFCARERVCAAEAALSFSGAVSDSITGIPVSGAVDSSGASAFPPQARPVPPSVYELQEISVNAGRVEVKRMIRTSEKISQVRLSPELVTALPNAGQADLFRSLQLLPGVSGTNEASSGLFVRGGTPDQNLIILDQMPIYYVDHFYGFFSAFNPRAIGDMTFYKGGFGAKWGGRVASVVEMVSSGMDAGGDSSAMAGIGGGLLSSDAIVKLPLNKNKTGTLMIAGRRSMSDVFKTDLFSRIFNRMHGTDTLSSQNAAGYLGPRGYLSPQSIDYQPKFYFWDLNGLAVFRLGSRGKLATTFFASHDDQNFSIDTAWARSPVVNGDFATGSQRFDTITNRSNLQINMPVLWGNICIGQQWEQNWSDAYKTRLNLSYSQFLDKQSKNDFRRDVWSHRYSDMASPLDSTYTSFLWMTSKNQINDFSGRFDNSWKLSNSTTLNAGVELSQKTVLFERDSTQPDTNSPAWQFGKREPNPPVSSYDTGASIAVYAEDEMRFGDKAYLTPGLRFSSFRFARASAFDPRISGWYKPFRELKLKAAWGIYTQEIHRAEEEDITGGSKFLWLLSGPDRPLEKSQNIVGGALWETSHFLFDVEGYTKRTSGLLAISERMRYDRKYGQHFDPNNLALFEGSGFAKGVELLAQVKDARFWLLSKNATYNGWAAYTLSRTENTFAVYNKGKPFPATQDHTHEVKLINTLEWDVAPWSSIDCSAIWLYSTGAPYTAPIGAYRFSIFDGGMWDHYYTHISDRNAYRLPDYHRLDLSAAWKLHFGPRFLARLTMGLFNAYNHENILERTYSLNYLLANPRSTGRDGNMWYDMMGDPAEVFLEMNKKSMSIMPNAAFEITVKF
jgi:ferric enterobactin receptor